MAITGGFGVTIDTRTGTSRRWFIGRDGVKRWADTGAPTEPACDRSACKDHSLAHAITRNARHFNPRKAQLLVNY